MSMLWIRVSQSIGRDIGGRENSTVHDMEIARQFRVSIRQISPRGTFVKRSCLSKPGLLKSIDREQYVRQFSLHPDHVEAENDAFFDKKRPLLPKEHPLAHIRSQMIALPPAIYVDKRNNEQARLLWNTLTDFLPKTYVEALTRKRASDVNMPPGYQMVYFPLSGPLSQLMDDGTDPQHSPGHPYNRRMWAGGVMHFCYPIPFDSEHRQCLETIHNVEVKGREGEEKVLVFLKRSVVEGERAPSMIEGRTLVFLRDQPQGIGLQKPRVVKPPSSPHFSHTLTPTAGLLFRFSALSYNAHRIHLDKDYCRNVEGHRNLLVHGPLTLILMLEMLAGYVAQKSEEILRVDYRNLAPLYVEEAMTVCGRERASGEYDVWIEGKDGGLAVKGSVKTQAQ